METIVITWPESQKLYDYMDRDDYEENVSLLNDPESYAKYGPCTYEVNKE